jgi:hypothetical protein
MSKIFDGDQCYIHDEIIIETSPLWIIGMKNKVVNGRWLLHLVISKQHPLEPSWVFWRGRFLVKVYMGGRKSEKGVI